MPNTFSQTFTYQNDSENTFYALIYKTIRDCTNSMQCHITIWELFMNALKLSSKKYRTGSFQKDDSIPQIPDDTTLTLILAYIPQELQDDYLEQVMFENWNIIGNTTTIGNNAWYVATYLNSTTQGTSIPQELQEAVNIVTSVYYAQLYNELQNEYASKNWNNKQDLPTVISIPQPPFEGFQPKTVKTAIDSLNTWIPSNDPKLVALSTLKGLKDAPIMLSSIFGTAPIPNLIAVDICLAMVNQIQKDNEQKANDNTGAVNLFFTAVLTNVSQTNSFWLTNSATSSLAGQFKEKNVPKWVKNNAQGFQIISQMFSVALNPNSPSSNVPVAMAAIYTIFTYFNTTTTSKQDYLKKAIGNVCDTLMSYYNPDTSTLTEWSNKLQDNIAIPPTIHYSCIDTLMKAVCDVVEKIPFTYKPSNPNPNPTSFTNVKLFAFSCYDDLSAQNGVCMFPKNDSELNSDIYLITADADEYTNQNNTPTVQNQSSIRPVYCVLTDPTNNNNYTYLKFFNVGGASIPQGSFYFTDSQNPTLVQTNDFSAPNNNLYFDFSASTINGNSVVPATGITGIDIKGNQQTIQGGVLYKTSIGASTSRQNFFQAIKLLSQWKNLNGQRQYDALYQTDCSSSSVTAKTHLIWRVASGNLNRADKVDDSLYTWGWDASDALKLKYPQLPALLGLSQSRDLAKNDNYSIWYTRPTDNYAWFTELLITQHSNSCFDYVPVNTPHPNLPAKIDECLNRQGGTSKSIDENLLAILSLFNFQYYRKVSSSFERKIIKWLPANQRPDRLDDGLKLGNVGQPQDQEAIGINIPIAVNRANNVSCFKQYTGAKGPANISLKNKGSALYRAQSLRLSAGSVMAKLRQSMGSTSTPPGTSSSLSANDMSKWLLKNSPGTTDASGNPVPGVLTKWQQLKQTCRGTLPTDQEWCHLLGHGDGGDERLENFVSGSYHCNTEQLAMESKERRQITQNAPKGTYELRSTAYLFNDNAAFLSQNYLNNDKAYNKQTTVYNTLRKSQAQTSATTSAPGPGSVMPFAAFIRYKMYKYQLQQDEEGEGTAIKLFDHIFEGQSEFIDEHQFNILKHIAWFAVAGMEAFKTWYKDQIDAMTGGKAAS